MVDEAVIDVTAEVTEGDIPRAVDTLTVPPARELDVVIVVEDSVAVDDTVAES